MDKALFGIFWKLELGSSLILPWKQLRQWGIASMNKAR